MSEADAAAATAVENAATTQTASVEAAPPQATPPEKVDDSDKKIASNGGDIPKEPLQEDDNTLLKRLFDQRAAFKRLKDQVDGEIECIDRDIDVCKKARLMRSSTAANTANPADG